MTSRISTFFIDDTMMGFAPRVERWQFAILMFAENPTFLVLDLIIENYLDVNSKAASRMTIPIIQYYQPFYTAAYWHLC